MKRLIVISVIFALVAGAAFAEINVGGAVFGRWDVLQGTSQKDIYELPTPDGTGDTALNGRGMSGGGAMTRLRLDASGESDDGTFGGYFRYDGGNDGGWSGSPFGNAWWKPIDQFKLLIGSAGYDGFWNKDGVARWGFYRDAGDVFGNIEGWAYGAAFYDGFTKGALLTITPLEALEINIGIPFFDGGRAEGIFKKTEAQVAYTIDGIGQFAITYRGGYEGDSRDGSGFLTRNAKVSIPTTGDKAWKAPVIGTAAGTTTPSIYKFNVAANKTGYKDGSFVNAYDIGDVGANGAKKFFAYFDLGAIENLGIQLGVGFTLPQKYEDERTVLRSPGSAAVAANPVRVNPNYLSTDPNLPAGTNTTDAVLPATAAVPAGAPDYSAGTRTTTDSYKYNPPLAVGLGVSFDAGAFGIKARIQGEFAEKLTWERTLSETGPNPASVAPISKDLKGPFVLTGDILPSFAINDSMKIFLSAGLKLTGKYDIDTVQDNPDYKAAVVAGTPTTNIEQYIEKPVTKDSVVGWHIMPYFTKSVGWCQGFYAGFRLESTGSKYLESYNRDKDGKLDKGNPDNPPNLKTILNWSVPIGVAFQF